MRRYTTPTHTIIVSGEDLSNASVWVTYRQANNVVTIESPEVEYADGRSTISVVLTEKDTSALNVGNAKVQVNWVIDGVREATEAVNIKITENLLEDELIQSDDGDGLGLGLGMSAGDGGSDNEDEGDNTEAGGEGDGDPDAGAEG